MARVQLLPRLTQKAHGLMGTVGQDVSGVEIWLWALAWFSEDWILLPRLTGWELCFDSEIPRLS